MSTVWRSFIAGLAETPVIEVNLSDKSNASKPETSCKRRSHVISRAPHAKVIGDEGSLGDTVASWTIQVLVNHDAWRSAARALQSEFEIKP
jgi:hypothetical protein